MTDNVGCGGLFLIAKNKNNNKKPKPTYTQEKSPSLSQNGQCII